MDIVLIFNGLGNQMSQYAFYLAKKQRDPRTRCLYYPDPLTCQHNGYELDKLFGIRPDATAHSCLGRLYSAYLWSQVCDSRKRHWLRVLMHDMGVELVRQPSFDYCPEMLVPTARGYRFFSGGWHHEGYLSGIEDEVRRVFSLDESQLGEQGRSILCEMVATNSVSIHVRRGDFLTDGFGGICTPEYYKRAIELIRSKVANPHFFVFSDDMDWCRAHLREPNTWFVDIHSGHDSWKDMLLMSRCKHHINANSTFSWWGAWLDANPNKLVIVPNRFMQDSKSDAIYPKSWIRIS